MKLQTLNLGSIRTNCYFIINEETKETIIVDPAADLPKVLKKIEDGDLKPVAILLTHGHFDHTMAVPGLKLKFNIPVHITKEDRDLAKDPILSGAYMIGSNFVLDIEDLVLIEDEDQLEFAGFHIKVIKTPGHTAGSVSYYFEKEQILISGDTLFYQSVGRTDLPTGDGRMIVTSIEKKLMGLPDEVKVYPGHGVNTTIGHEKKNNPFIYPEALWQ